jgi:ATP-dependent Clp protease ATP-binding subunit ClpC
LLRDEEALPARVLAGEGVTVERVRAEVTHHVGQSEETRPEKIPFTQQCKWAFDSALKEALAQDQKFIEPQHILLGLLDDEEQCLAVQVLRDLGADTMTIRGVGRYGQPLVGVWETTYPWIRG